MTTKAIEAGGRAIAVSYGEDPDDYASLLDICGPNNEPLPIWQKYAEPGDLVPASVGQRVPLDCGKLVQCILRCMDANIKNESSREQAERIATAIEERFDTAPARAVTAAYEQCAREAEWEGYGTVGRQIATRIRALSPAPAGGDWRDISTAPKDGTRVLVWSPHWHNPCSASWYGSDWRQVYELPTFANHPTHWMPLPEPPTMLNAATKDGSAT